MAPENRQQLIDEANELGLEFAKNISTTKLQEMVNEEKGIPPAVDEPPVAGPAVKADEPMDKPEKAEKPKIMSRRLAIAQRKKAAMATRVVTLTNRDSKDNDVTTTALLSFENQHFGLSKVVPLDVPIELEVALINIAEATVYPMHVDEIKNGKRTGNKITKMVKKYTVSYAREQ